jgi:hypothetical protein
MPTRVRQEAKSQTQQASPLSLGYQRGGTSCLGVSVFSDTRTSGQPSHRCTRRSSCIASTTLVASAPALQYQSSERSESLGSILQIDGYEKFFGKLTTVFSERTTLNVGYLFNNDLKQHKPGAPPGQGNRPNVKAIYTVHGAAAFLGPVPQKFGDGVGSPANPNVWNTKPCRSRAPNPTPIGSVGIGMTSTSAHLRIGH